jgi:hypothetical protein
MPGFWKKALIYLGLVEEEDELEPLPTDTHEPTTFETVRPIRPDLPSSSVRRIGGDDSFPSNVTSSAVAPRQMMHVVEPRAFNDAKEIGDKLKVNTAVIMNLQHATPSSPSGSSTSRADSRTWVAARSRKSRSERSCSRLPTWRCPRKKPAR